jgi:uncharacterized protein (DUF1501 family)
MYNRRQILRFGSASLGLTLIPSALNAASAKGRRLVFIVQRGAADGLATVMPVGDPSFTSARKSLSQVQGTKLDALFSLHPALTGLHGLYQSKEALFVHAVASPYRDRSHFDAQNILESGGAAPYAVKSGWLNRFAGMLNGVEAKALALAPTIPMALRGDAPATSYAPSRLPDASQDMIARVGQMYAGDAQLHDLWEQAITTRNMAGTAGDAMNPRDASAMGGLAARLMTGENGARIAMLETNGWDTHSAQAGRLNGQLKSMDALITGLKTGLGAEWANTLVIVATEFGRTVSPNGTGGTDHGTASAAMLIGGGVKGGRVVADWPGLSDKALYEGRDLRPTLGLDALIVGALAQHYAMDPALIARTVFPMMTGKGYDGRLVGT